MEIHLADSLICESAVKPGATVTVAISGGTGLYCADAVIQRYYPATRQLIIAISGSFRFEQRRQHERYRCHMPVRLRVVGDTQWTGGECRDISAGGARIYLPKELVLRSNTVELVFISPTNQQGVRAMAEVVRTSKLLNDPGWEIGVRFTEMERVEKIQFARLLQYWASAREREPVRPD
jgi:c-di-GMP-binding flagellar brake protein YcgR